MNKVKSTTLAIITTAIFLTSVSFTSSAMDKYVENALIDICKSALSNSVLRYNSTIRSYHLRNKDVLHNVVCNGYDIASFAKKHGAKQTADRIARDLEDMSIIDVASKKVIPPLTIRYK